MARGSQTDTIAAGPATWHYEELPSLFAGNPGRGDLLQALPPRCGAGTLAHHDAQMPVLRRMDPA